MRRAWWAVAIGATVATGCGVLPGSSAAAVWTVAPGERVEARTSEVTVVVTRVGCNGGITGEVQEPEVGLGDDEVVLTFSVTPGEPSGADCQANDAVPYDLVLPEPLGERSLVDGQCRPEGEASGTSFCRGGGVRHRPAR